MPQYEGHPYTAIIPEASADRLKEITESIHDHGLYNPITLYQGQVLDGRTRLAACEATGVKPRFDEFKGDDEAAIHFVIAQGIMRRDLDSGQRAAIKIEGQEMLGAVRAAKQRQAEGGRRGGKERAKAPRDEKGRLTSTPGSPPRGGKSGPKHPAAQDAAESAGTSARTVERVRRLKEKAPDLYAKVRAGKMKPGAAERELKKRKQAAEITAEPPPLPEGPFRVIVIDPPWRYENRQADTTHRARSPYPPMSLEEIKALPVAGRAHDENCVLWLWTTNAHIWSVPEVLAAWGFTYKNLFTWVKDKWGTGDWGRGQTEHVVLAVRGKPAVDFKSVSTVITGPLRKHSQKPDEFYAMVETTCPGSKLEMFSRQRREGWEVHGDEV